MKRGRLLSLVVAAGLTLASDCAPVVDATLSVDPNEEGTPISRALLGQYDISGALLEYDTVPELASRMGDAGLVGSDWRVGLGRWEVGTQLFPTLSDGTPCAGNPWGGLPPGTTDLELLAARDWFVDDGAPVTPADTQDDGRYALSYVRSVVDVAHAFGATPFLSVDLMPRALAANRTPLRTDCEISFANRVSNVRPADPRVFALAVRGMVERLVLGHGGEGGRALTHIELWNEPELASFWDPEFEDRGGPLDRFFEAMVPTLVELDAMRASATEAELRALRFGLGSYASAGAAVATIEGFDGLRLPTGSPPPLDFISFHAYRNDPLEVVDAIRTVADAAAASTHYAGVELSLAEWGANLEDTGGDLGYAQSMAPALHATTVLVEGAALGLDRAHHAIFWDFFPAVTFGLLDPDRQPKPLHHAYALLAEAISGEGVRLEIAGAPDGRVSDDHSVLATREPDGTVHWIVVHRGGAPLALGLLVEGRGHVPSAVRIFDDPSGAPEEIQPAATLTLPPESIAWLRFDPAS